MNLRQLYNKAKKSVEMTAKESIDYLKRLFKIKSTLTKKDFKPGSLIALSYDAKDKKQMYDKTPLILVLKRNKTHTLAINFHWAPLRLRIMLVEIIIATNRNNIKNNKPLEFSYEQLKPVLKRLGFAPIIRLYINKRLSNKGIVIPSSQLLHAAKMKSETFTGGKASGEQLYKKAVNSKKI